jgi:predicted DNA-binding protein YlxM (UPF0122 family)
MDTIKIENWMTVAEYATKHKITVQAVYKAIKKGQIETRKLGSLLMVHANKSIN